MIHLLIFALALGQGGSEPLEGLIVSVRGNIYVVRPTLRARNVRVLIGPSTEVSREEPSTSAAFKPGLRVAVGGVYDRATGFQPYFINCGDKPIGALKAPDAPLPTSQGFGTGIGTLVSVRPFVFKTKGGSTFKVANLEKAEVWKLIPASRQDLLIGTRVAVRGRPAPDGVIQADSVTPDRGSTQPGTMFATLKRVEKGRIVIRPKYSLEDLAVTVSRSIPVQKEVRLDPDSIHIGQPMTLWASPRPDYPGMPKDNSLVGFALLKGSGRYPKSSDASSGAYYPGTLSQLEPDVRFTSNGKTYPLLVPAQFIVAELKDASLKELKPGQPLMLTLKRRPNGSWVASRLIIDASAWVGYGL